MFLGPIALLATVISSVWFVTVSDASDRAKIVVSILCLGSLSIGYLLPQWAIAGLLLQTFLVIGIAMYAKVRP